MAVFLLTEIMCLGVFMSQDLYLFYVFFEGGLIPMYMTIGIWGGFPHQGDQRGLLVAREEVRLVGQALGQVRRKRLRQLVEQAALAQDTPSMTRAAITRWNGMMAAR